MDREYLYRAADDMRANPPPFFQLENLHELDDVTTVEEHRINTGSKEDICFYLIKPRERDTELPFVMNFHGGGMVREHGGRDILLARRLAYGAECAVISVDYRLAPQYPYPYALDEAESLLKYVLNSSETYGLSGRYAVFGQSSGGNLAVALTRRTLKTGMPLPALLITAYSWLDMVTDPEQKDHGCPAERASLYRFYQDCYLDGVTGKDIEISPSLFPPSEFIGFPETYMIEGGLDELRNENLQMFRTLCEAGVKVTMTYFPRSMHGFMVNQKADWRQAQKLVQQKAREVFQDAYTSE